ncbi:MAG: alkylmercury lyase [Gemmatimonadales bacterium]|nr:alkylmercury lyase [Gemmatimonadales bacterium]NIN11834.1 alkylmercury lyase [Gemmatimonadales bacterium]NIN50384.1 alkylmercury lyase [Gemmatimonadales bacterium]NIP07848.1 alkylmercury lyase [Gemmatimonadales bacterium]NIR02053.1 alkylmercury lyase [Gemmatimonadales bacterium]
MKEVQGGLDDVLARLSAADPELSESEQHLGLELYRLLARGAPVRREQLAQALAVPTREVVTLLEGGLRSLVLYDDDKRIIGFGGLAVVPMAHRFTVRGRTMYNWCAWDGLFIPQLLGVTAELESSCPQTQATIQLTVTPAEVTSVEPRETVISLLLPDLSLADCTTEESIFRFCHYVFFLASPEAGTQWTSRHEGTFLLSLEDGFRLGRMHNAVRFGAVLGRAASGGTRPDQHDHR